MTPLFRPLPGCGERAGGQHSAEAAARQRCGSGSDPERRQTHRHPGAGARPGDHQPLLELTQQAGTTRYERENATRSTGCSVSHQLCRLSCPQVAERIAQLQEALLHCGKFQDALEPLLSWLSDTEELVANQKPPSAEYRVVKAQIQEQKVRESNPVSHQHAYEEKSL